MKSKFAKRGAFFGTAIFLGCLATPAYAIEVAGNLLIDLDAADYVQGADTWNQHSATAMSIQGPFTKVATATPQKVMIGGAPAVVLDGDTDFFTGPNTTAALHAASASYSVEYWVLQGLIEPQECVVSWSSRGNTAQNAAFNYSSNVEYGAVGHWGAANDMGFVGVPSAGSWHLISYTYDGAAQTQKLYVDGVLNSTKTAVVLDAKDNLPINVGASPEANGTFTNKDIQYSGAIGKIRIHSGVLTNSQVTINYNTELPGYPGITPEMLPGGPINRFSFSNPAGPAASGAVVTDSVSGLTGKIVGSGATFTGTKIQLPGGAPADAPPYVDLPNGIISSKQRISIEVWYTQTANLNWSRVFSFGTSTIGEVNVASNTPGFNGGAGLEQTANNGTGADMRLIRAGGTISNGLEYRNSFGATVLNTQVHQVAVFDPDRKEWRSYRNGYLMESLPETQGPSTIPDVNNWLGRSAFAGDSGFAGTFDEFRIYNYTLTGSQIRGNTLAGPDVVNTASAQVAAGWLPTAGGTFSFNDPANWSSTTVPNGPGTVAALNSDLAGDETVNLNAAISVGGLTVGDLDGSNKFTVAAGTGGSLTLDAGAGMTATLTQRASSSGATISAPILLNGNAGFSALGNAPLTLAGTLGGSGNVTATGPGSITLTGDYSGYTGTLTLAGGQFSVGNGGTSGILPNTVVINSPARLVLNRSDAFDLSQTINGNGANAYIQQDGAGQVTITGAVNSTGFLGIKSGTSLVNDGLATMVRYLNVNGQLIQDQPGANLTVTGDFNVGDTEAGPSSILLSDGTMTGANLFVGKNAGTSAAIVQTGGSILDTPGGGDVRIGGNPNTATNAFGSWRVLGGTATTSGNFQIGAFGTGIMEVAGDGKVFFNTGGFPVIARFQTATSESYGLLDISGAGEVQQNVGGGNRLIVAEEGYGVLNVREDGLLTCVGGLLVGATNVGGPGDGTVNLSGNGIIEAQLVDQGNPAEANGSFNFHGGVLRARGDNGAWFQNVDNAVIWSEGLYIDTNGKNVISAQTFSDPAGDGVTSIPVTSGGSGYLAAPFVEITGGGGTGATAVANVSPAGVITGITVTNPGQNYTTIPEVNLRGGVGGTGLVVGTPATGANLKGDFNKLGQGNLTLTNGQTFTGNTLVTEGALTVNGTFAGGLITVETGGTLSGSGGFVHNLIINGTLRPGKPTGALVADNVTFGAGSTLSITIDDSDPSSNFNGQLDAIGNIDISNVNLKVNVTGVAARTDYQILTTTGNVTGDFASVPAGVEYTISGGTVTITKAGTPFQTFIGGYFPGETDPEIVGEDADPDGDGSSNLVEFALGGNPKGGGDGPKVYTRVADSSDAGAEKELLMTLAVLPGFPAAPASSASYKGVNYQIQGSLDLVDFTSPVSQVDPVVGDLPAVPAGYEYRTFRLDASNGLPNKGFLRVEVK